MEHEVQQNALNHYVVVHRVAMPDWETTYEYLWNHHHHVHVYRIQDGDARYRNVKVFGFREKVALIPLQYPNQDYPTLEDARLQAVAHAVRNLEAPGSLIRTRKGEGGWEQVG